MDFKSLFNKKASYVGIDIGSLGLRIVEISVGGDQPKITKMRFIPLKPEFFQGYVIPGASSVGDLMVQAVAELELGNSMACVAIPAPAVFNKRLKVAKVDPSELNTNIQFEAAAILPGGTSGVKLDYHVLGESGKNYLEVLILAVKNDIVDAYTDTVALGGLQTAVVDIETFAFQNIYELCNPEDFEKTIAYIHIGARYSAISVCKSGVPLVMGDSAVGGRQVSESIVEATAVKYVEAEELKKNDDASSQHFMAVRKVFEAQSEKIASELVRQVTFLWNAAGGGPLNKIVISGGGALLPGLIEKIIEKSGVETSFFDPVTAMTVDDSISQTDLDAVRGRLTVACGLAIRQIGDKEAPEFD